MGASDIYVSKLNANGDFVWAKIIGGTGYDGSLGIQSDTAGYIYTTGYFESTVDFDPGTATFNITAVSSDIFTLKLNGQGNLVWAKTQGGSNADMASGLDVDPKGNVHVVGAFTGQADFDPGTAVYNLTSSGNLNDIFICKLSQDSCANLALSIDSLATIQCAHPGYISMNAAGGKMPYLYSWAGVPTVIAPAMTVNTSGVYQLTVTDNIDCTRTTAVLMNGYAAASGFDMNVNLASEPFMPNFSSDIFADAYNDGCAPVNGLLKIVLPNEVVYNNAIPVPSQISGDTLIWSFSNNTYDSPHITPRVNVTTKSFVAIGDTICLLAIVTPVNGDINPSNNVKTYCSPAVSSFDPNDKHVYPAGDCTQGYVLFQTPFTYTINFQNTGTVAARNIYIVDSLDSALDLNTVRVIGSSHPMITEVMPGHVLKFRFDNIFLPDSASDEPLSHGYVMFEAQHIQNIPSGTQIRNRSAIHFDFNTPIITNEVLNTVVSAIPQCSDGTIQVNNTANLKLYPNPSNNILTVEYPKSGSLLLIDVLGRIVADFELPGDNNKLVLNTQDLAPGVYIYKYLPNKTLIQTGKFTIVR
ncbi:MAG TPA: T9SS type A sorting domain-containing protein [Flavipsychrobacter sp.]|nr:T9SS type A sorting domain-containing protein [Flavipsychrobacter sp.]